MNLYITQVFLEQGLVGNGKTCVLPMTMMQEQNQKFSLGWPSCNEEILERSGDAKVKKYEIYSKPLFGITNFAFYFSKSLNQVEILRTKALGNVSRPLFFFKEK